MRIWRWMICAIAALGTLVLAQGCVGDKSKEVENKQIAVTIPPLQGLVEEIIGADYEVVCLLPAGSSPETYSPTARQIASLSDAEFVFTLGTLAFEEEIIKRLDNQQNKVVKTARGIELLTGCGHEHHNHHNGECSHEEQCAHCEGNNHNHKAESHTPAHHHHSFDPHVWLAPEELGVIATNIAEAIVAHRPDSVKYRTNYERLKIKLAEREVCYGEALKSAPKHFLIYHPALGYLAADYGLEQISLENEGKSPTPAALAGVVDMVAHEHIESMFYQQGYPLDIVKPIAEILSVNLVEINPLSKDIIGELDRIVGALINSNE